MQEIILDIFKKTCFNRYFELKVAELHQKKLIKVPMYLSVGGEHIPAALSSVIPAWPIFVQHRCHSYFLSRGGSPEHLLKELMARDDGINGGRGGSPSISSRELKIFGHSGLLGDQVPIGVGYAHASGLPTIIIAGDAAMEEDYALGALGYAASKRVPVLIVCEDNDLSILTRKSVRRSWDIVDVAKGFGINAYHVEDDPLTIRDKLLEVKDKLPVLLNIRICRYLWHAGSGCDGPPDWNRFEMFKQSFPELKGEMDKIETDTQAWMEELCRPLLKQ